MAWPSTPLRTYIANSTPTIRADDLNALQTGVNGLVNGTYNVQALTATAGTPGSVIVPALNGAITVSATVADSVTPNPSLAQGVLPKGLVPIGAALVTASGLLTWGQNVFAAPGLVGGANHPVAGQYYVQFNVSSAAITNGWAIASPYDIANADFCSARYLAFGGQATAFVVMRDNTPALADIAFQVILYAE